MDATDVDDQIFPDVSDDWLDTYAFKLNYKQHGGSGLSLSLTDVESMSVRRILWWSDHLDDTREREADAIKSARDGDSPGEPTV